MLARYICLAALFVVNAETSRGNEVSACPSSHCPIAAAPNGSAETSVQAATPGRLPEPLASTDVSSSDACAQPADAVCSAPQCPIAADQVQNKEDAKAALEQKRRERDALDAEIRALEQFTGPAQILVSVTMVEVSRTKLRALGVDWARVGETAAAPEARSKNVESVLELLNGGRSGRALGVGSGNFTNVVIDRDDAFLGILEALRRKNIAKVLAEPKLVVASGRPASLHVGGEIPVAGPDGGTPVEYKEFGTRVDCLATQLSDGRIRLEARPRVTELLEGKTIEVHGTRMPAISVRTIDTAAELKSGQTVVLAGLVQERTEAAEAPDPESEGGKRLEDRVNEVELLVLMKCEVVEPIVAGQAPDTPAAPVRR